MINDLLLVADSADLAGFKRFFPAALYYTRQMPGTPYIQVYNIILPQDLVFRAIAKVRRILKNGVFPTKTFPSLKCLSDQDHFVSQ